jgi:hypothetical protein
MLTVLSLGAGVQSTTMALMAAHGLITPMPDCAIFADTQWEPKAVYEHLRWLMSPNVLPFPVHIVSAGDLRADALRRSNTTGGRFAAVPWHMKIVTPAGTEVPIYGDEDDEGNYAIIGYRTLERDEIKSAMGRRQCTKEYKLRPIQRKGVELLGGKRPKAGARLLIGISTDEAARAKPSQVQYIVNHFPLLDLRMSRNDCLRWLERHDYPKPPKSSCIGCPFHSDTEWRSLTTTEFADAVEVDTAIRRQPGFRGEQYMHRSLKPLSEVDLSTAEERGQGNLFNNDCEGMCGV